MNIWIPDPKNNEPSVSLTLLTVSFLGTLIAGALQMTGKVATTSIFPELTYSTIALYFGRRFSSNGKLYSSEQAETIVEKVSK